MCKTYLDDLGSSSSPLLLATTTTLLAKRRLSCAASLRQQKSRRKINDHSRPWSLELSFRKRVGTSGEVEKNEQTHRKPRLDLPYVIFSCCNVCVFTWTFLLLYSYQMLLFSYALVFGSFIAWKRDSLKIEVSFFCWPVAHLDYYAIQKRTCSFDDCLSQFYFIFFSKKSIKYLFLEPRFLPVTHNIAH